ncbi:hypothetical protein NMY22_g1395 [Coprinellus aureogranulatus]|nr:hypothetical protein NMY22_g1395 [Coprinellus aureogranulatus]
MLTFFDIPCKTLSRAWSPNTWKVRYYLNYHRIPYRTQWVELPNVESTCISLGIPPSKTNANGKNTYTLPAVHDTSTNKYVSESARIMKYLDGRYPTTTSSLAFPKGTDVLQSAFLSAWTSKVIVPLWNVITPDIPRSLNEESRVYFEETRQGVFGKTLDELDKDLEGKRKSWEKVRKDLGDVDRWFENGEDVHGRKENGEESLFVTGKDPVFADFVMAATFAYMRNVWGEDDERWKEVAIWHGGRWARFVDALREYEQVN